MSVQEEIDSARRFGEQLENLVVRKGQVPSAGDREMLLLALWSLILDYHKGVITLLSNQFYGSAFALMRIVLEAAIRAHVVLVGSDDDVQKIMKDEYRVNFKTVGAQIDTALNLGKLFENFLDGDALHSFTHSGVSQLARRFSGDDLQVHYTDCEIIQVIRTTTTAVFIVTNLVAKRFKFEDEAEEASELFTEWGKH